MIDYSDVNIDVMRIMARQYRDVASYLTTYGWAHNALGLHGGPRCLVGAINSVVPDSVNVVCIFKLRRLFPVYRDLCDRTIQMSGLYPVAWNDNQKDASTVIGLCIAAAEQIEAEIDRRTAVPAYETTQELVSA